MPTPEEQRRALFARSLSEADPTLGGLIPGIGLSTGPIDVVPDQAIPSPGGIELYEAEERALGRMVDGDEAQPSTPEPGSPEWFRASQDPTSAEGLFDRDGSPMIQPERGLGPQLGVRSRHDMAWEEFARSPVVSALLNMGDVLPIPLLRAGVGVAGGGSYEANQDVLDDLLERGREEHPYASATGALAGIVPQLAAPALLGDAAIARLGGSAAGSAIPALSRVGAAGLEGGLYGLTHGLASGDVSRGAEEGLLGGGLGAGVAGAAQGVGSAVASLPGRVPGLEEWIGRMRLRASGGRTVGVQRALDALPGGSSGVAEDLVALGISPRYSVHTVDDARRVSDRVRERAGRNIGRVFDRMAEAEAAAPDAAARDRALQAIAEDNPSELLLESVGASAESPDLQLGRQILMGRLDRRRAAQMAAYEELAAGGARPDPQAATEFPVPDAELSPDATRRIRPGSGPARSAPRIAPEFVDRMRAGDITGASGGRLEPPYMPMRPTPPRSPEEDAALRGLLDELFPERPGTVDVGPVADALDRIADSYRGLPSGARGLAAAESLARDYRATGGRLPFGRPRGTGLPSAGAQKELDLIEQQINRQPGTNPVNDRMAAIQDDLRDLRSSLRSQMDRAVMGVDPELGATYPRQRREYQIGKIFGNLGEDDARREAANRLVSPTDYAAAMTGNGSMLQRALQAGMNRAFRGREASLAATVGERTSDAFRAAPDIRGAAVDFAARATRAGSLIDGDDPQPAPAGPATLSTQDFRSLVDSGAPIEVEPEPAPTQPAIAPDLSDDEFEEFMGL